MCQVNDPVHESREYIYVKSAYLHQNEIHKEYTQELRETIQKMLDPDYTKRPTIDELLELRSFRKLKVDRIALF